MAMALARNCLSRRLQSLLLLDPQSLACGYHIIRSDIPHSHTVPPFHHRHFASSPRTLAESDGTHGMKSLQYLFQSPSERTGGAKNGKFKGTSKHLEEKAGHKESKVERVKDLKKKKPEKELKKPKKWKVKFVEEDGGEEVDMHHNGEQPKKAEPKRLYDLFSPEEKSKKAIPRRLSPGVDPVEKKEVKQRESVVLKELSSDMEVLVSYLYKEGYFNDANFVKGKRFDLSWFDVEYARYYTLSVVQKFGKDKQEIAQWLSGSDLKQVAMFGCPSDSRSQVFPSKRLRSFFKIPENTVCSKCVLRDSCKYMNQSVWGSDSNTLDLSMVMKIISSYAMSFVHPKLVVPNKINNSVNRLLKEVAKLSPTI